VFGIIKSVMGFRQFLLRGLDKVRGESSRECLCSAAAEHRAVVCLKTPQTACRNTNIPPGNPKSIAIIKVSAVSYRSQAAQPALYVTSKLSPTGWKEVPT
jgi:hypothetical protein